jgi:hypothetical protein
MFSSLARTNSDVRGLMRGYLLLGYTNEEKALCSGAHLFLRLEDIAAEHVALSVPGDVAEDLQILRVVGHVEYSGGQVK